MFQIHSYKAVYIYNCLVDQMSSASQGRLRIINEYLLIHEQHTVITIIITRTVQYYRYYPVS